MNQQFRNRPVRTILSIALAGCLALSAALLVPALPLWHGPLP